MFHLFILHTHYWRISDGFSIHPLVILNECVPWRPPPSPGDVFTVCLYLEANYKSDCWTSLIKLLSWKRERVSALGHISLMFYNLLNTAVGSFNHRNILTCLVKEAQQCCLYVNQKVVGCVFVGERSCSSIIWCYSIHWGQRSIIVMFVMLVNCEGRISFWLWILTDTKNTKGSLGFAAVQAKSM